MLFFKFLKLNEGKVSSKFIWDLLLFRRKTFLSGEDIVIPVDKALVMISPDFQGGVTIEGELIVV